MLPKSTWSRKLFSTNSTLKRLISTVTMLVRLQIRFPVKRLLTQVALEFPLIQVYLLMTPEVSLVCKWHVALWAPIWTRFAVSSWMTCEKWCCGESLTTSCALKRSLSGVDLRNMTSKVLGSGKRFFADVTLVTLCSFVDKYDVFLQGLLPFWFVDALKALIFFLVGVYRLLVPCQFRLLFETFSTNFTRIRPLSTMD